jgi:pyruvate kinase
LQVISTWGVKNKIDFLSLSYTRHAEDVRQVICVPHLLCWFHRLKFRIGHLISFYFCSRISTNISYVFKIQAREFLSTLGDLSQTQIFAKIENVEVNWIS